jgi:hypothetical protein
MAPRLLMHREAGTFEELPAHDVGMQSDSVIVLDHGTDVFIWTVSILLDAIVLGDLCKLTIKTLGKL